MFEKDLMKGVSDELNALTEEEKAARAQSLQKLLEAELNKRQSGLAQGPQTAKPKPKLGFWANLKRMFNEI